MLLLGISVYIKEQHLPIIDTVNGTNKFTNKWKSQINVQGKNNGAVTTRKYALFKDKNTDGSFKPIVEPIKQDPQKIDSKNHYFSKSMKRRIRKSRPQKSLMILKPVNLKNT